MNIIFDVGSVLLDWNMDQVLLNYFNNENTKEKVKQEIFEHPSWIEMDRGIQDENSILESFSCRTGLTMNEIHNLMDHVRMSFYEMPIGLDLLNWVVDEGHDVYCLSNMSKTNFLFLAKKFKFYGVFQNTIISGCVKKVKPEIEIYKYAVNSFGIIPDETLFIDDRVENIEAASKVGIHGIVYRDNDLCVREIKEWITNKELVKCV